MQVGSGSAWIRNFCLDPDPELENLELDPDPDQIIPDPTTLQEWYRYFLNIYFSYKPFVGTSTVRFVLFAFIISIRL